MRPSAQAAWPRTRGSGSAKARTNPGTATGSPESQAGEILESLDGRRLVVLLDYDGTLSPIAPRPEDAVLPAATRSTLQALAARWPTAIISGRDR